MENEFSSFQLRWFTVREEKAQAANKLNNVKRAEEELDDLVEQKNKVELEEKVILSRFLLGSWLS